jgi:ABC-2 type transport system permease protein
MPFAAACPDIVPGPDTIARTDRLRRVAALAGAGFRRYSTYRQATVAGMFTNIIFGAMLVSVMLAAADAGRLPGGYTRSQLVAFVWIGQGLLNVTYVWGWRDLADRIRSGEVTADLLRPVDPLVAYAASDLGRAAQSVIGRWIPPVLFGVLVYDMYLPQRPLSYPLFALSVGFATLVSFGGRYLVNLWAFWLLDIRGPLTVWVFTSALLSGNYFPTRFLPGWAQWLAWCATPFPCMFQVPLDIAVERTSLTTAVATVALQLAWIVVLFALCRIVQRRALLRLVVQGG